MTKRVVDNPGRDPGWHNGKYTIRRNESDADHVAHCAECDKDTPHAWDNCTVCLEKKRLAKRKHTSNRGRRRRGKKK
jgi:hypothetical protein